MGEDGGKIGGAEAGSDGGEVGSGGTLANGAKQVEAIAEQRASGVQQQGEVVGESGHGLHGSVSNTTLEKWARNIFSDG